MPMTLDGSIAVLSRDSGQERVLAIKIVAAKQRVERIAS